jgi:uncharacterized membrane protein
MQKIEIVWKNHRGVGTMRVIGLGHLLFAVGLAGLGVLSLFSGDFPYVWQPVPVWVPWREALAHASGLLLLSCSIGMLITRTASLASFIMAIYLLGWVLVLQAPRVAQDPTNIGMWLGVAESTVLMSGGWILFASLAGPEARLKMPFITSVNGVRTARLLVGIACLILGASHFVYADGTAGMVPAWLPDHLGFAYLTGAGHLAAGLGILFGVFPRLAATLEAAMISLFVLLLHIPGAASQPASRMQWTMVFVASALAGGMWVTAKSLQAAAWGWARKPMEATAAD